MPKSYGEREREAARKLERSMAGARAERERMSPAQREEESRRVARLRRKLLGSSLYLYRFALFSDQDATEVHTYGFVLAHNDGDAFRIGADAFPDGDSISEAKWLFGIEYDPDEDDDGDYPFFSVNHVEDVEEFTSLLHELAVEGRFKSMGRATEREVVQEMARALMGYGVVVE